MLRVRVMIDVDASGAAVSEFVAGERTEQTLKAGRSVEHLAQRVTIYGHVPAIYRR